MILIALAAALGALVLTYAAPFPFALDARYRELAVWRMPPSTPGPRIYLTFDDGPNPAATPALLDVLKREGALATFFVIDRHLTAETAPIVRRAFAEGHDVALHSETRRLALMAPGQAASTLTNAALRIEQLAGRRPCRAFRPHAGFRSAHLFVALQRIDHAMIGWGWNLWDWNYFRRKAPESIVPRLVRNASDGDIIVMHDGHHKNPRADRRYTVETTARLIPALRGKGFSFGTVCEGLAARRRAARGARSGDPIAQGEP
jgi:peptidoglycan-N-acetylglucosamine deacetylase